MLAWIVQLVSMLYLEGGMDVDNEDGMIPLPGNNYRLWSLLDVVALSIVRKVLCKCMLFVLAESHNVTDPMVVVS